MNVHLRSFGWLLLLMGTILTLLGVIALPGWINVRIDAFGVDLDTLAEQIAWIVCWVVMIVTGGLLLGLTNPHHHHHQKPV